MSGSARIRTDSVSSMGDLLLRGWTMLAESCPDCLVPLMRDPATRHQHCVNCRQVYTEEGDVVNGTPQVTMSAQANGSTRNTSRSYPEGMTDGPIVQSYGAGRQQPLQSRDRSTPGTADVADLLAGRMQEGWALLNDTCPMCSNILMRNRQRLRYCVVCDAPVLTEREAAARPPPEEEQAESNGTHTPATVPASWPSAAAGASTAPAAAAGAGTLGTAQGDREVYGNGNVPHIQADPGALGTLGVVGFRDSAGIQTQLSEERRWAPRDATGTPCTPPVSDSLRSGGATMLLEITEVQDVAADAANPGAPAAPVGETDSSGYGTDGERGRVGLPGAAVQGGQVGDAKAVFGGVADGLLAKISELRHLLGASSAAGGNVGLHRQYVQLLRECMSAYRETSDHINALSALRQ